MSKRRWEPSQLVVACFSRHDEALAWAEARLCESYGAIAARSADYDFHHTEYYADTMGPNLKKRLLVFGELRSAGVLPAVKNFTIGLEAACAERGLYPEKRPLNLDPGLLQLGKFVLASTKDQSHRVYIGQGIYAENTLRFHGKSFRPWPWSYADYREPSVRRFLTSARMLLHENILQLRRDRENLSEK